MSQTVETSQVGKREALLDFICVADVKDKPLLAMIPKEKKARNMLMSWQADKYSAPNTGGVADGVDVENFEDGAADRALIQNYQQKFRRSTMVGDLAENVSEVAGAPEGELARALDKKTEELSRDIEAALCSDNDANLETGKANPYKTRGLGAWIKATAGTPVPVPAAYLTPAASIDSTAMASFTESLFKGVLGSMFIQYGKRQDLTLVAGTDLKTQISTFTQVASGTNAYGSIRTFNQDLDSQKITSNITIYEGDFNTVHIVPSLLLANGTSNASTRRGYLLAWDFLGLAWNRSPRVKQLPDLGGGPRGYIDAILGLVYKNPLIGGKFAATS